MSDYLFSSEGSQSKHISFPAISSSEKRETKGWVPRAACSWNPTLQMELLNFFEKLRYPDQDYIDIPFKEPLRSEIRRFLVSLDAYLDSPNPVVPEKDILYGATYNTFALYLKRVKRKSFETKWRVDHFALPDWWNDVPAYDLNDIGDIFNYSYLIFWEGESDDYLHGFEPVVIKQETLTKFKEILFGILPDRTSFSKIDPWEVLTTLASSMSIEADSLKHEPHFKIKNKYLYFSKKEVLVKEALSKSVQKTAEIAY
jgi:hypothetical protein